MNYKIFLPLIFSIFLLSMVSATIVVDGYFQNDIYKTQATITNGESIILNAIFSSTASITSKEISLPSGLNSNKETCTLSPSGHTYSCVYSITPSNTGIFTIQIIGKDNSGSIDSETLTLTVNALPTPINHAPVITSTAITNVNEGATYNYDVSATDSDGNTLTYSLTLNPSWLTINPTTGLISGVAPLVSSDSDYDITVEVSDGTDTDTQSYTLTVSNVLPSSDITPPEITVVSPEDREYDTHTITLRVLTDEPADVTFRLDEGTLIEMNNPSDNLFTYTLTVDNDGDHIITFHAEDNSGNTAREYARFSIEIHESHGGDDGGATTITTPDDFYYQNKYYDQFNPNKVAYTNKTIKTYNISVLTFFYFLIAIISLGIIIVVFLLGRNLRR